MIPAPKKAVRPLTPRFRPCLVPALLIGGLLLRLLFIWFGARFYYKNLSPYMNNDTYSFTQSFLNLLRTGVYTFNPLNPEAAFGRLPGFPFFWGGHYLVFGPGLVYQAVAFSQAVLDTVAIYFVYATALALTRDERAAWLSGLLYATYPFVLVWLTISGSEALATFCTLAIFWWLTTRPVTGRNALLAGLLVALALMVREYLGILLLAAFFWVYCAKGFSRQWVSLSSVVVVGFLALYSWWPIRNYVFQHRLLPIKTATAGYDRYAQDVSAARQWIYCWSTDANLYLDAIAGKSAGVPFPAGVFGSPTQAAQARALFRQARACGSGFHAWRYGQPYAQPTNCNAELALGFASLRRDYQERHPVRFWLNVPLQNLRRALFKSRTRLPQGSSPVMTTLFAYRSLLIMLSLLGAALLYRRRPTRPIVAFFWFMYIFLCLGIRHLEIRYLLQADAAMLVLAGVPLVWGWDLLRRGRHARRPA